MIPPQFVEVYQGLLTREEVNPERVAQDRRPRESSQLHGFLASSLWIVHCQHCIPWEEMLRVGCY